jgi:drug/metabolite transporter (DMT)-like permease
MSVKTKLTFAYVALALIWGSSFLFMKVALEGVSPTQVVLGRLGIGAVTLVILMLVTRRRWPREARVWGHLTVVALFLCVFPFLLFAWAGLHLPSGVSSILNAMTPIMTVLVSAVALPSERLDRSRLAGIALGVVGVAVVAGIWNVLADPALLTQVPALLACLGATLCYGIGLTYIRRFLVGTHNYDALTISAVQIVIGAVMIGLATPIIGASPVNLTPAVVLSLVALGALGTGIAYIWNVQIVTEWGPAVASSVTYATPLVGVTLGVFILGEHLSWNEPAGGVIVVLGILLVQGRLRLGRRPHSVDAQRNSTSGRPGAP